MDKFIDFISHLFIGRIIRSNIFTAVMQNEEQSVNSHVEEYLDYYCNLEHSPEFAVLLKGDWGSGKTHFIKQYIKKLERKRQKSLYVSLYGMASFSDIEFAFFQQLYPPFLTSKKAILVGKLFGNFIKGMFRVDLNSDGKDDVSITLQGSNINLINSLADVGQNILIFDDLERCKIELNNVLGYINNFIEHQGLKVIIIANESKIENEDKYKDIKEKLIGKTFDIDLDFESAFQSFLSIIKNLHVKNFLSNNIDLICNEYEEHKYKNLRTLRQIILDFERIYIELPEKARKKEDLLQDVLKLLMSYSVAIKSGEIQQKSITDLRKKRIQEVDESSGELTDKIYYKDWLRANYLFMNPPMIFPNELWWQTFLDKGISDTKELKESIQNSRYFQDEKTPDCIRLRRFQELSSDEDFENLLYKVESKYINREYTEIGEIRHIVGLLLLFSDSELYPKSKDEILQDGKLYVDYLRQRFPIKIIASYNTEQTYKGLDYFGTDFEEFKEFSSYISEARELAMKESINSIAQDLLKIMQYDTWRFCKLLTKPNLQDEDIVLRECYRTPVLKHIEPRLFVNKFLVLDLENRDQFFWAINERYKLIKHYKDLHEEMSWLCNIRQLLLDEIGLKKHKLSGFLLSKRIGYLDSAIKKLESKQY